jgi:hypothetical protein
VKKIKEKYKYILRVDESGENYVISDIFDNNSRVKIELVGQFSFEESKYATKLVCMYKLRIDNDSINNCIGIKEIKLSTMDLLLFSKQELINRAVYVNKDLDSILDNAVKKLKVSTLRG